MENSTELQKAIDFAFQYAINARHMFVTPEHLLVGICNMSSDFTKLCDSYHVDCQTEIKEPIFGEFGKEMTVPEEIEEYELLPSMQLMDTMEDAVSQAENAGKSEVEVPHVLSTMMKLDESQAGYILKTAFTDDVTELLQSIVTVYEGHSLPDHAKKGAPEAPEVYDYDDDFYYEEKPRKERWRQLVTCVNDCLANHNPLIGREAELDRTIQVLCRRDKNNPLHVGEPGVGKTALVYGLAQRIEDGNVPERLKGAKIYMLDMGTLVAGTQFRGEFEERIKNIMKGAEEEKNAIIYIDEIHTLIGSGATSEGALDGSNILKPYLESGNIRFIGSTTYKEYNRYFQKSQGIVRRFQQIDIPEPTEEETISILEGLRERYETFHGVKYANDVIEHAVKMSVKYIHNRFLPDKAIDLIDEAGAYRELHPITRKSKGETVVAKTQKVDCGVIDNTVKRICKLTDQTLSATSKGAEELENLAERMKAQIYGQNEAVAKTVEAVMMGKAGLLDSDKPVASMLFVGPTGVGKTEVCKVLAKELGLELVRFDMSEYTEKHTVAKLIGSPAGYVGYEDGGLLTDAIRKTPNCVLLLDEIEKAHSDIYNILLQVMDYARLTDNKGQKADFRHVILIMTSNAGAQYANQASVGFASQSTAGQAMLQAVKKTFKPEFLGRLSSTVVFNDMDETMARLILEKKLRQLSERLVQKNVTINMSDEAMRLLLKKGYTRANGAREFDRIINMMLTPLLTREILFGKLKNGGETTVKTEGDNLLLTFNI